MARARPTRTRNQAPADGPPALDLELVRRLKMLAFANVLPLGALVIGSLAYASGSIKLRPDAGQGLVPILVLLGACLVLAFSCWMIVPMGRWLRDWPRWHYRRKNKLLWFFPALLGLCGGFALWSLGILTALASLVLVGIGLVRLWELWG